MTDHLSADLKLEIVETLNMILCKIGGNMEKTSIYVFYAAGILLLVGIFPLEYSYYTLLKGVVSVAAVLLVISAIKLKQFGWLALAIPSFALWFPLFEVENDKKTWVYLDLVFGIVYFTAAIVIKKSLNGGTEND